MQTRVIGNGYAPGQLGLPVPVSAGGTGTIALAGNSVLYADELKVRTDASFAYVCGNLDVGVVRVTQEGLYDFAPGNVLVENADLLAVGKATCANLVDGANEALDAVPGSGLVRPLRWIQREIDAVRKGFAPGQWWPRLAVKTVVPGAGSFAGAVGTHRDQIAFVPYDASHVGLLDIRTRSFETIDVSPMISEFGNVARFKGGVLTRRGRIAMVPWNATHLGLFDPFTKTTQAVATGVSGTNRFFGGALLPNGRIVLAPYNADVALTYDEVTNAVSQVSLPGSVSGNAKYAGAVLLPSGNVCFVPHTAQRVAVMNGTSVQEVGGVLSGGNKYVGGVLVPSGKVVFVPYESSTVGIFDPETGNTTQVANVAGTGGKYAGGLLTPDGKVLFVPHDATSIALFDPDSESMAPAVNLPAGYSGTGGKFLGGAVGFDGDVYLASHGHPDVCTYGTYPISDIVPWHHPYLNGSL